LPWILYIFGIVLIVSGLKMGSDGDDDVDPEKNLFVRLLRRFFPITKEYHGRNFFIVRDGKRFATPLLIVLIAIETTDLIFALDSIPAVFGVTRNHFVAYSSNIMAVLGLRALYFALAGMMGMFRYLRYGLSAILVFIGAKMLLDHHYPLSTPVALTVIGSLLALSVGASVLLPTPPLNPGGEKTDDQEEKRGEGQEQGPLSEEENPNLCALKTKSVSSPEGGEESDEPPSSPLPERAPESP